MKTKIFLLALFITFITPSLPGSIVEVQDGVIYGNRLPYYGVTCESVAVLGSPHINAQRLYILPASEVRIYEQSKGGGWVMIKTAEWIPLSALCRMYDK